MPGKSILAICGSNRQQSSNRRLLQRLQAMSSDQFHFQFYDALSQLPAFNPDLDVEPAPEPVQALRRAIGEADGLIFSTPEYAMALPGAFKNLLDWTVSSASLMKKPTVAITASSSGELAHASLLKILQVLEADMRTACQLHIPFIQTKLDPQGQLVDLVLEQRLRLLLDTFQEQLKAIS